jgi:hypothetical protein
VPVREGHSASHLTCAYCRSLLGRRESIPTLWVVPDLKAQQVMSLWALELCQALAADPSIFWITRKENISQDLILAPIWQVVGVERSQSLIPDTFLSSPQAFANPPALQPPYEFGFD